MTPSWKAPGGMTASLTVAVLSTTPDCQAERDWFQNT